LAGPAAKLIGSNDRAAQKRDEEAPAAEKR
jgi:hypothetical protein